MKEEWREVPGYQGIYEVSSSGRVRSYYHGSKGFRDEAKIMRQSLMSGKRYKGVDLYTPYGEKVQVLTHQLVARAFLSPEVQESQIDTTHIDGIKQQHCYTNLEQSSRGDNVTHARQLRDKMRAAHMRSEPVCYFCETCDSCYFGDSAELLVQEIVAADCSTAV